MAESARQTEPRFNIGEVLQLLREEFPGVSIPKIRFLEDKGLIKPERTPAGYRKFSDADVVRLRYILRMQRDHYLPLRVIGEQLAALANQGERAEDQQALVPEVQPATPSALRSQAAVNPRVWDRPSTLKMTRAELLKRAQVSAEFLAELESTRLVVAQRGTGLFIEDDLAVIEVARELADYGIETRHLRAFKTSADREASLIARAGTGANQVPPLASSVLTLHALLVKRSLFDH